MTKSRIEAFSDGVIAILITIMVLEFKVPEGADQAADRINGTILWANLHLLFWLSLIPFVTGWMGHNHAAALPTATYGVVMLFCGFAYWTLQAAIVSEHGPHSRLATALGSDRKATLSLSLYAASVPLAFVNSWISALIFVIVALMWLVPDRRIESQFRAERH